MTATVDIITDKRESSIAVPISAIVIKTDTSSVKKTYRNKIVTTDTSSSVEEEKFECVFVNENSIAKLRVVKTGIQDDTNIEIVSGLKEGDKIITGPYNLVSKTLKPGEKVEEKNKKVTSEEEKVED
jgi:HlyD family secretion protein